MQKTETPLILELKASKHLKRMLACAHLLALAAGWANSLPFVYKVVLSGGIAIHCYYALKHVGKKQPILKYAEASGWEIGNNNEFDRVSIRKSSVLTVYAIWLHVKKQNDFEFYGNTKRSMLIVCDALEESDFRRLIVKLKTTVKK